MKPADSELQRLRMDVERARRTHRDALRGRRDPATETSTRADVLVALENFVHALQSRQLPVPPTVQRDIALLQNLCRRTGTTRRPPA